MNDLSIVNIFNPTMSSREIAELCEKRHDNVMRDIRVMLAELYGEGGVLKLEDTHRNEQNGQEYPIFRLPKDLTLTLVSGYKVQLRKRIIDRWLELEEKQRSIDPREALNDPAMVRGLLLNYTERVIKLEQKVGELEPKADAFERIADSEGLVCITDASKILSIKRKDLITWMHAHRWIYRRGSRWVGHEDKTRQGLLDHKYYTIPGPDGQDRQEPQVYLTAKGVSRLSVVLKETTLTVIK